MTDPHTPPPAPEVRRTPRGPGPRQTKIGIHSKSHCQHRGSGAAQSQTHTGTLARQDVSRALGLTPSGHKGPLLSLEHVGWSPQACQVNPLPNTLHMPGLPLIKARQGLLHICFVSGLHPKKVLDAGEDRAADVCGLSEHRAQNCGLRPQARGRGPGSQLHVCSRASPCLAQVSQQVHIRGSPQAGARVRGTQGTEQPWT